MSLVLERWYPCLQFRVTDAEPFLEVPIRSRKEYRQRTVHYSFTQQTYYVTIKKVTISQVSRHLQALYRHTVYRVYRHTVYWVYRQSNVSDLSETGFIYALMSASAMVGVVDACSDGDIYMCGCREMNDVPDPQPGWTWGGCSDAVDNGGF